MQLDKKPITYQTAIFPYIKNSVEIHFTQEEINKVLALAMQIASSKANESHHIKDHNNEVKRFFTGLIGEMAVEKLFNISIIDWSVSNSRYYDVPDIPGYTVGIKTVEKGKFPVIPKKNKYAQIICIYNPNNKTVNICGLATKIVLNKYQSDELILSPALRSRNVKTGFYGFHMLIPLHNVNINILSGNKVK